MAALSLNAPMCLENRQVKLGTARSRFVPLVVSMPHSESSEAQKSGV